MSAGNVLSPNLMLALLGSAKLDLLFVSSGLSLMSMLSFDLAKALFTISANVGGNRMMS